MLSEPGILVQSLRLSCRVSSQAARPGEGSADAAGRRSLLTFFRCRKKVSLGSGVKLPTPIGRGCRGATLPALTVRRPNSDVCVEPVNNRQAHCRDGSGIRPFTRCPGHSRARRLMPAA